MCASECSPTAATHARANQWEPRAAVVRATGHLLGVHSTRICRVRTAMVQATQRWEADVRSLCGVYFSELQRITAGRKIVILWVNMLVTRYDIKI